MKKRLILVLAILVTLSLFACNSTPAPTTPTTPTTPPTPTNPVLGTWVANLGGGNTYTLTISDGGVFSIVFKGTDGQTGQPVNEVDAGTWTYIKPALILTFTEDPSHPIKLILLENGTLVGSETLAGTTFVKQ